MGFGYGKIQLQPLFVGKKPLNRFSSSESRQIAAPVRALRNPARRLNALPIDWRSKGILFIVEIFRSIQLRPQPLPEPLRSSAYDFTYWE